MLATTLSVLLFQGFDLESRRQFIEKLDKHYQERFLDLDGIKDGRMGLSRVEMNDIKDHALRRAVSTSEATLYANVTIYGAHGKPLKDDNLRLGYSLGSVRTNLPPGKLRELVISLKDVTASIPRFQKDRKLDRIEINRLPIYAQLRPVRLSRAECLSCHVGMKIGDTVAIAAYTVTEWTPQKPPPRGTMAGNATARRTSLASPR